jgi:hypothetical protein
MVLDLDQFRLSARHERIRCPVEVLPSSLAHILPVALCTDRGSSDDLRDAFAS